MARFNVARDISGAQHIKLVTNHSHHLGGAPTIRAYDPPPGHRRRQAKDTLRCGSNLRVVGAWRRQGLDRLPENGDSPLIGAPADCGDLLVSARLGKDLEQQAAITRVLGAEPFEPSPDSVTIMRLNRGGQRVRLQPEGQLLLADCGDDGVLVFEIAVQLGDPDARHGRDLVYARLMEALVLEQRPRDIHYPSAAYFAARTAMTAGAER